MPHRTAGVAAALEDAGARGLPLPPYGPDDTPIEARSSKVERWLRRAAARAKAELNDALGEALRRVTPEDNPRLVPTRRSGCNSWVNRFRTERKNHSRSLSHQNS